MNSFLCVLLALFASACASRPKSPCLNLKGEGNLIRCHDEAFFNLKTNPQESTATLSKLCRDEKLGRACSNLGFYFENPASGGEQNFSKAAEAYQRGCDLRDGIACNHLANMYILAKGKERNNKKGTELLSLACDYNYEVSCYRMASIHMAGKLQPNEPEKIFFFMKKGCELGDAMSCHDVAFFHMEGMGTQKNIDVGIEALERSCQKGFARGCSSLGFFFMTANPFIPSYYPRAFQLMTTACQGEDSAGCDYLGYMYETGTGVQKDLSFAAEIYSKACLAGQSYSCGNLGRLLAPKDEARALPLLERGCSDNNGEACRFLANFHTSGRASLPASKTTGLFYHKRACLNGDPESCAVLSAGFQSLCRDGEETLLACPSGKERMSLCQTGKKLVYRFGTDQEIMTEYEGDGDFKFEDFPTKQTNELRFTVEDVSYAITEEVAFGHPLVRTVTIRGNDDSLSCEAPVIGSMDKLRRRKVFAPEKSP